MDAKVRCSWCENDPLYIKYHDEKWGVPVMDDRKHFEFSVLESAQAGLSWLTILIICFRSNELSKQAFTPS